MNRRKFISQSALATCAVLTPQFLNAFHKKVSPNLVSQKKLIIIQLSGGNDGLNTIVPCSQDAYYKLRPTVALQKNNLINLTDGIGLNGSLPIFKSLYDNGDLCIINNVGYPDPDLSHFRAMDIWQTASGSDKFISTGWIGRYLDNLDSEKLLPHKAIEFDGTLSIALRGERLNGFALNKLNQLTDLPNKQFLNRAVEKFHDHNNETNSYLYKTLTETIASTNYLSEKNKLSKSTFNYPDSEFAKDLKNVSTLLNSGIDTSVYYVSMPGFDTHVNQTNQQNFRLNTINEAMEIFIKDLKDQDSFKNVLIMIFSEFGRRVAQNANNGTDHGSANVLFLIGGGLKKKGIYNTIANLNDLDNGNLKYSIDFRAVYADILDKWLNTSSVKILGESFESLHLI